MAEDFQKGELFGPLTHSVIRRLHLLAAIDFIVRHRLFFIPFAVFQALAIYFVIFKPVGFAVPEIAVTFPLFTLALLAITCTTAIGMTLIYRWIVVGRKFSN